MARDDEWWLRIAHAFAAHVRDERYVLARYEELAASTGDAGTRFLLELIVEDERRHHALFERLGEAASAPAGGAGGVPGPPHPEPRHVEDLLAQTQRFLEIEHEDDAALKDLARELRPGRDETMWRLLVEVMRLDTEKHIRILEFLRDHLEELAP